jgi:GntR family transcriptional regulator of arabinose operon
MLLANGNYDPEKEKESAKRMLANGVSGIIVEPTNSGRLEEDSEIVQVLNRSGVPVVTTNCEIPGLQASFVTVDDTRIGEDAVDYLLGLGHSRIACVFKSDTQAGELRYQGYARALERAGIPVDPELARFYTQEDEPSLPGAWFTREILESATTGSTRPTAFVYFNDQVAHQAYAAFAELGLNVPGDVSVVGIDNIPEAVRAIPPLTTFNHPKYVMGKLAAEIMLGRLGTHDDRLFHGVTMRAQLVQRDSTARIG